LTDAGVRGLPGPCGVPGGRPPDEEPEPDSESCASWAATEWDAELELSEPRRSESPEVTAWLKEAALPLPLPLPELDPEPEPDADPEPE